MKELYKKMQIREGGILKNIGFVHTRQGIMNQINGWSFWCAIEFSVPPRKNCDSLIVLIRRMKRIKNINFSEILKL
jgi:hypothetical protein